MKQKRLVWFFFIIMNMIFFLCNVFQANRSFFTPFEAHKALTHSQWQGGERRVSRVVLIINYTYTNTIKYNTSMVARRAISYG